MQTILNTLNTRKKELHTIQGYINISGKIEKKIIFLKGFLYLVYPDKIRLDFLSTFGNTEKILIINSQNIILKDLTNNEISIEPYSKENFYNLTGINYDPQELFLLIAGIKNFNLKNTVNIYEYKNSIILKNNYPDDKTEELWWDRDTKTISKISLTKDKKPLSEINFSDFFNSELGIFGKKINISKPLENFKLKILLNNIKLNSNISENIFDLKN